MARFAHVLSKSLFVILLIGLSVAPTWAVLPDQLSASSDTGTRAFISYSGSKENINLTNGNLNIAIPLVSLPGRNGHDFTLSILYDSKNWLAKANPFDGTVLHYYWTLDVRPPQIGIQGWRFDIPCMIGGQPIYDPNIAGQINGYGDFLITLPGGGKTWIPTKTGTVDTTDSEDGSFVNLKVDGTGTPQATLKNGTKIFFAGFNPGGTTCASKIEDTDGNTITIQYNGASTVITDTVGRQITINYTSGKPSSVTYKDSTGTLQTISFAYASFPATPSFTNPIQKPTAHPPVLVQPPSGGSNPLLSSVTLPTQRQYAFDYSDGYGDLTKITYPTGGYTSYVYTNFRHQEAYFGDWTMNGLVDFREVTQKRVCRAAVGGCSVAAEDVTTYAPTTNDATNNVLMIVTDPTGAYTKYQISACTTNDFGAKYCAPLETMRWSYSTSNILLRTVKTEYIAMGTNLQGLLPSRITTTLNDTGQITKTEYSYDTYTARVLAPAAIDPQLETLGPVTRSNSNVTQELVYDFSTTTPPLLRKRVMAYLHVNAANANIDYSNTTSPHILDRKTSEQTWDPSTNTKLAETLYEYDSFTEGLTTSGAVQHTASFSTSFFTRGKQTTVKQWRNTDGAYLITRFQYDDAGNNRKITDPRGNNITMSYADSWGTGGGASCTPTGGNAAAYLTSTTNPLGQITTATYNSCAGTTASITDPNNLVANYSYDLTNRRTQVTYPSTGQTSTTCFSEVSGSSCYNASTPLKTVTTSTVTASANTMSTTILDGLGRVSQTQLADPEGTMYADTTYDSKGRTATLSNPYRSTSSSTDGITTDQYDDLNRVTQLAPPDGTVPTAGSTCLTNNVCTSYSGNAVTVTDQAGKKRKTETDVLGRLKKVWEDPTGLNYETDYQYDVLNNVLRVDQKGGDANSANWRTRTFVYDSLSRLLTASNPESGTITYAYDTNASCASPNSYPGLLVSRTDARGIRTCLQYDNGNRVTQKNYSDTTPTVRYGYDANAITGCTTTPPALTDSNPKGYRTAMCDGSGATSWNHDVMGRVLNEKRTIQGSSAVTKSIAYTYNLDGSTATLTYPAGRVITYQLNTGGTCGAGICTAGRFQSAIDAVNSINYLTSATYTASGAISGLTLGTAIQGRQTYNSRLQPLQLFYTTSTVASDTQLHQTTCPSTIGNLMHRIYNFGFTVNDNRNVNAVTNCRDTNRTQNFSYDALNRITQGNSTGTNWGETYAIDPWGNLTNRTAIAGKTNPNFVQLNAAPASAQNRLPGFGYDAAGNMTSNGSTTYSYDAENHLTVTAGVTYTYDGDGNRVKKSSGILYWMGGGSAALTETDLAGTATADYILFNGRRVARVDQPSGNKHFYVADHLGSASVVTNNVGAIQDESDYYPYGGEMPITDTDSNRYKFTGKERDTESGLDDFVARYYSSALGRFMIPDWAEKATAVPYAVFGSPQSLNLYGYVENNPSTKIDPDGHAGDSPFSLDNPFNRMDAFVVYAQGQIDAARERDQPIVQAQNQSAGTQPEPTNPDGKPKPPTNDVPKLPDGRTPGWKPGDPLTPNDWEIKDSGKGERTKWGPKYPVPGQSQPNASWDPLGHWDHNDGKGNRTRWLPGGGGQVDHFNNPIPYIMPVVGPTPQQQQQMQKVAEVGVIGTIIIIIYTALSQLN